MEDTPIFPDPPAITVERTLAIIKPDAIHRAEEVMEDIKTLGFSILQVCGNSTYRASTLNNTDMYMYKLISLHRYSITPLDTKALKRC